MDWNGLNLCEDSLYWHHCYSGAFDLINSESIAHPAKMSPALCYRILDHLKELGLLKDGDAILDPMGGTGITAICAGAKDYKAVTVELEEKFVDFQWQNKDYASRKLHKDLDWTIIKGDSRRLSELLKGQGLKSITSPPYSGIIQGVPQFNNITGNLHRKAKHLSPSEQSLDYGTTPGQIGKLKDTPLKSITSPPYAHPAKSGKSSDEAWEYMDKKYAVRQTQNSRQGGSLGNAEGYGDDPDNIGNLPDKPLKAITSPPYQDILKGQSSGEKHAEALENYAKENPNWKWKRRSEFTKGRMLHWQTMGTEYSDNPDNIGNLPDKPLKSIVSPPYGETGVGDWKTGRAEFQAWVINEIKTKGYVEWQGKRYNEAEWRAMNHGRIDGRTTKGVHKHPTDGYSDNPDNIGGLPDKPLKTLTSPPYEDNVNRWGKEPSKMMYQKSLHARYGDGEGQIGKTLGESYLEAMKQVYAEIAKVSDVLCVVIKNPTRNGKLRRLDLDTTAILKESGWNIHCQHRALLFEELEQPDLFGKTTKKVKGRLSFFKRLAYVKGSPVASWEDILVCVRS